MGQTQFMNVDLELDSAIGLEEFSAQFATHGFALHEGESDGLWHGRYELNEDSDDLGATLSGLCEAIESLTGAAREAWNGAKRRDFSIGIQGGTKPRYVEWTIDSALLNRISEVGARVTICVYADDPESDAGTRRRSE